MIIDVKDINVTDNFYIIIFYMRSLDATIKSHRFLRFTLMLHRETEQHIFKIVDI